MFAKTFTDAVTRWRREQRPRAGESWYAVHYRSGWLIERMNFRESVELLRQGLDVRAIDPKDRGRRKRRRAAVAGGPSEAGGPSPPSTVPISAAEGGSETLSSAPASPVSPAPPPP